MIKIIKVKQQRTLTEIERIVITNLYLIYGKRMIKAAMTIDGVTRSEAEEIVGQKLIDLVVSLDYQNGKVMENFLSSIARNAALDAIKIPKQEQVTKPNGNELAAENFEVGFTQRRKYTAVQFEASYSTLDECADDFIIQLKSDFQRDVLILKYWKKLDIHQIALVMASNAKSISSTLTKLKKEMRKEFCKRNN